MMKLMSRALVTAAAASMAFAPIAVQANTRAGDSTPVYTTNSQPGLARTAEGEDMRGNGTGIILAIFAAAAAIAGIIIIADGDDGQSPGT